MKGKRCILFYHGLLYVHILRMQRSYYTSFVWTYYQPDSLSLTVHDETAFAIEFIVSEKKYLSNMSAKNQRERLKKHSIRYVRATTTSDTTHI